MSPSLWLGEKCSLALDYKLIFFLMYYLWISHCGGKKAREPESVHVMDKGRPNPRTRDSPRIRKTLPKSSALVSEGMESNRNHSESSSRKSPSLARQCRGEKGWPTIKSDTPNHSVEQDKYWKGTGQRKALKYLGESYYRIKCTTAYWTMLFSLSTTLEDFWRRLMGQVSA